MQLVTYMSEDIDLDCALLHLVANGVWASERQRLCEGITAVEGGLALGPDELRSAEETFRRGHGLLAAEDLRAWLGARELSVGQMRAYLRVAVAASAQAAGADSAQAAGAASARVGGATGAGAGRTEQLRELARPALIIGGAVAGAAEGLVRGAAALDLLSTPPAPDPAGDAGALARVAAEDPALPLEVRKAAPLEERAAKVLRYTSALAAARREVLEREVGDVLAENRVEWTELEYSELSLPTPQAAREAMMCLKVDHLGLAEVAALAGAQVRERSCTAGEVGADLGVELLASRPGAPLGPVPGEGGWSVVVLRRRHTPGPEDEAARQRALDIALGRRLERRLAGRAKWHVAVL